MQYHVRRVALTMRRRSIRKSRASFKYDTIEEERAPSSNNRGSANGSSCYEDAPSDSAPLCQISLCILYIILSKVPHLRCSAPVLTVRTLQARVWEVRHHCRSDA